MNTVENVNVSCIRIACPLHEHVMYSGLKGKRHGKVHFETNVSVQQTQSIISTHICTKPVQMLTEKQSITNHLIQTLTKLILLLFVYCHKQFSSDEGNIQFHWMPWQFYRCVSPPS